MPEFQIRNGKIELPLTSHRSKIRIADENGNHVSKTINCAITNNLFIEYFIRWAMGGIIDNHSYGI